MKNICTVLEECKGKYLIKSILSFIVIGILQVLLSYIDIKSGFSLAIICSKANDRVVCMLILMTIFLMKFDYDRAKTSYESEVFTRIRLLPKGKTKSFKKTYLISEILFMLIGVLWMIGIQFVVNFSIISLANYLGVYETHGYTIAIIESIQNMKINLNLITWVDVINLVIIMLDITMMGTLGVLACVVELKKGSPGTLLLVCGMMILFIIASLSFGHEEMIYVDDLFFLIVEYVWVRNEHEKLF